jgi:uncharacterized protein (DUF736 family)
MHPSLSTAYRYALSSHRAGFLKPKEYYIMSKIIGTFTVQDKQFAGVIRTLHLNTAVRIVPTGHTEEKAPDFRVMVENYELGAAWSKKSEQGNEYLSIRIDDPSLPAPLNARLVSRKDSEDYLLIWSR